ncbi:MAG: serine hydrolase [Chloroflexi bacterium]|nr:serine hydrolase [Chloroflexota bacterium]
MARLRSRLHAVKGGLDGRLAIVVQPATSREPPIDLDGDAPFSSASIIKLPILWSFFEQADRGRIDPTELWPLTDEARVDGTGVLRFLQSGARLTLLDLATLMTVVSDNTATNALIARLGIATIQEAVDRLGLTGTRLGRRMYDFEARARGLENVATPRDIARLLRLLHAGDGLSERSREQARAILRGQQFNAGLPARLPAEAVVAHKTGNLPGLLHDAGWIEHARGTAIVVAFSDRLANDGDGAAALAQVGEAVWEWLCS